MFKGKKVIIFDLDGTLIDSIGVWNEIDRNLIEKIRNVEFEEIDIGLQRDKVLSECKGKEIYLEYCDFLRKKYNSTLTKEEILNLRGKIADEYRNTIEYKKDADKLLHLLKDNEFILALATTTTRVALYAYNNKNENMIKKARIYDIFSIILSKEEVQEKKPNPEVHYKILEKLNVKPEECLIIEDSLIGVRAAKNAGIDVVTVYDKFSDGNRKEINSLTDYYFENFTDMIAKIKEELEINN